MLPFIFYGRRASRIKAYRVADVTCSACGQEAPQDVHVFGKYAHLYWIPLFPFGKATVAECSNCLKTREQADFEPELGAAVSQANASASHPVWHWSGAGIVAIVLAWIGISSALYEPDPREALLAEDRRIVAVDPAATNPSDSTAAFLKTLFQVFVNEEMQPENFAVGTTTVAGNTLVLVDVPNLSELERSEWPQITQMVVDAIRADSLRAEEPLYVGIFEGSRLRVAQAPGGTDFEDLYAYYGPAEDGE